MNEVTTSLTRSTIDSPSSQYVKYNMADPKHTHLTRSAHKIIPHLTCSDIHRTKDFYTNSLHFELGEFHPDNKPSPMISVFMGAKAEANIYIFQVEEGEEVKTRRVMVGLGKEELDQFHKILVEEGRVEIVDGHDADGGLRDREWGMRQFEVKDGDGNGIQFWAFLED